MRILIAAVLAAAVSLAAPAYAADETLVVKQSPYDVSTTLDRLQEALEAKDIGVVGRFDHAANAKQVDKELPPTSILIFGNPDLGTVLMQASPTVALDLPMKVLAYEDDAGRTQVVYLKPTVLAERHGIPADHEVIGKMTKALDAFTDAAIAE